MTRKRTFFILPLIMLICLSIFFMGQINILKTDKDHLNMDNSYTPISPEKVNNSSSHKPLQNNIELPKANKKTQPNREPSSDFEQEDKNNKTQDSPKNSKKDSLKNSKNNVIDTKSKEDSKTSSQSYEHFNNKKTVSVSRTGSTPIVNVKGTGSINLVFSRDNSSQAPNLPTYASVLCDGSSVYSGAFNSTTDETFQKQIPYTGSCQIKVAVRYPSAKWIGTQNSVTVSYGNNEKLSGQSYFEQSKWTTVAVDRTKNFNLPAKKGFKGFIVLKLTACSSKNGASDKTAKNACDGYVKKNVGSSGKIVIEDGNNILSTRAYDITSNKHHDTLTIPVSDIWGKRISVRVEKNKGSAVLVHGTGGSSILGVS